MVFLYRYTVDGVSVPELSRLKAYPAKVVPVRLGKAAWRAGTSLSGEALSRLNSGTETPASGDSGAIGFLCGMKLKHRVHSTYARTPSNMEVQIKLGDFTSILFGYLLESHQERESVKAFKQ